jgi:hypothetical protein
LPYDSQGIRAIPQFGTDEYSLLLYFVIHSPI